MLINDTQVMAVERCSTIQSWFGDSFSYTQFQRYYDFLKDTYYLEDANFTSFG